MPKQEFIEDFKRIIIRSNSRESWKDCVDIAHSYVENFEKNLVNLEKIDGESLLTHAVKADNHYLVKYLCLQGASVSGSEPLKQAVLQGNEKIVQCLVEMGAYFDQSIFNDVATRRSKIGQNDSKIKILENIENILQHPEDHTASEKPTANFLNPKELDTFTESDRIEKKESEDRRRQIKAAKAERLKSSENERKK